MSTAHRTRTIPEEVRAYMAELGRKGATARNKALSPKQRTQIAKRAAKARWEEK